MTEQTGEIIMVLKGNHSFDTDGTPKDALLSYMSDRCDYPKEEYTDGDLFGIVKECVMDFMRTTDNPIRFMHHFFEAQRVASLMKTHEDKSEFVRLTDYLITALIMTQVRENGVCINGFTEESLRKVFKTPKDDNQPSPYNVEDYTDHIRKQNPGL